MSRATSDARSKPEELESLLIPVDLSPASDRVLGRVTLLPLATNAHIQLVHVVPKLLPRDRRRRAEEAAAQALSLAARDLARKLPARVKIESDIALGLPAAEIERHARACKAELIVMGRGGGRSIRDVFLGSTAERVIRRSKLPVLVVRLAPRERYQRPLLALDTDRAARDIVLWTVRVFQSARPRIDVVHAYDIPYYNFAFPNGAAEHGAELRSEYRRKALYDIARLLAAAMAEAKSLPPDAVSWKTHIRHGPPRNIIPETVHKTRADLLVLGTRGHTGVAHALLGSIAGDVLREVPCDVLVVPPLSTIRKTRS